jgi:outer membrane protein TolC
MNHRQHAWRRSWTLLVNPWCVWGLLCLSFAPQSAVAQQPATQPAYGLEDCVRIGLGQQPALEASRASLAAANTQRYALDRLVVARLISRELPIRRQQACLGVTIATAGYQQAEAETIYAVTRNFYSLQYARKQEGVARDAIIKLETALQNAKNLLEKGKKDPDIIVTAFDVERLAINVELNRTRLVEANVGVQRATAALREAMGLSRDYPLHVAAADLPPLSADLDPNYLIDLALARRGELVQATSAAQLTDLEVRAQGMSLMPTMRTFAAVSDIHSRPIPQGVSNKDYRPAAIGLDMPGTLAGRRGDRIQRAREFSNRAHSVVEKTQNLIVLETEDAYLKWQDAAQKIKHLAPLPARAVKLADDVQTRFNDGKKVSGEELIRARTLAEQTQGQLNEALYYHALALAALERITAGGFVPSFTRRSADK